MLRMIFAIRLLLFNDKLLYNPLMTDSNNLGEGKLYFKSKVGDLMQQYERSREQEMQHKQQLKQNIMLQIINNRQKLQQKNSIQKQQTENKSHAAKTADSDPTSEDNRPNYVKPLKTNQVQIKTNLVNIPLSAPRNKAQEYSEADCQKQEFAQITFNMKKRNKSLEEESILRRLDIVNNQPEVEIHPEQNKSIKSLSKYANKYVPQLIAETPIQQNNQFQMPNRSNRQLKIQNYEDQPQQKYKNESKYRPKTQEEDINTSKSGYRRSALMKKQEQIKKEQKYHQQSQQQENNDGYDHQVQQQVHNQEHNGVFLTMEQSESMTASELPKNYAFQIQMENQVDPNYLEQLKKQRIKEIEKKRQERIVQFRRNQSQKKVDMPRGRNSISKKQQKTQKSEQQIIPLPKSTTIERKVNNAKPPKMENRSQREVAIKNTPIAVLDPPQAQSRIKQNNSRPYLQPQDQPPKAVSPFRTPKTILSQNRQKSANKNSNIFLGESNRQKSASRMQPKIEPKERKNSFSRQSNKKLMVNAITHVCFPGELNRRERQKLVQVLQTSQHQFFVFLFKQYSRKIVKGIYAMDNSQSRLDRIYGQKAPNEISASMVQQFYRFDSGCREFKKLDGCRSFSLAVHAIDLHR